MTIGCAGVQREEAKDAIFWDMFEVRNPHTGELAEPWVPCEAAAIKGQKFVLHKVRLSHASGDRLLTMRFRWDAVLFSNIPRQPMDHWAFIWCRSALLYSHCFYRQNRVRSCLEAETTRM